MSNIMLEILSNLKKQPNKKKFIVQWIQNYTFELLTDMQLFKIKKREILPAVIELQLN